MVQGKTGDGETEAGAEHVAARVAETGKNGPSPPEHRSWLRSPAD